MTADLEYNSSMLMVSIYLHQFNVVGTKRICNIHNSTWADWTYVIDGNIKTTFHVTQACLEHLKATKGVILNMSSISGQRQVCLSHLALAHFASHRCGPSSIPGLGRGRMCEKFHQLLAVGRWFPPGTPVSSTRKLISSSSFHRLDMTLAIAEALNPNTTSLE